MDQPALCRLFYRKKTMLKYLSISLIVVMSMIILEEPKSTQIKNSFVEMMPAIEPPTPSFVFNPKLQDFDKNEMKVIQCLAGNIYFEARNEPVDGQIAVAFVTLNRVNSKDFPNDVCSVVKEKKGRTCQFSWYCESKPKRQYYRMKLTDDRNEVYNRIVELSMFILVNQEKLDDPTYGSLYYHANYVRPNWRHLQKKIVIGRHIFYTEKNNI